MVSILPESLAARGVTSVNFYDVFAGEENQAWIVGDNGIVLYSSTRGGSWEVLRIGIFPTLFSVWFKDAQEGFAVGQRGTIISTCDGGETWEPVESGTDDNLFGIIVTPYKGIIVGQNGTVIGSNDGGKTWGDLEVEFEIPPPSLISAAIIGPNSPRALVCAGENIVKVVPLKK
jgi:photosystem II stability/assembly factor-like uncharacterized protein